MRSVPAGQVRTITSSPDLGRSPISISTRGKHPSSPLGKHGIHADAQNERMVAGGFLKIIGYRQRPKRSPVTAVIASHTVSRLQRLYRHDALLYQHPTVEKSHAILWMEATHVWNSLSDLQSGKSGYGQGSGSPPAPLGIQRIRFDWRILYRWQKEHCPCSRKPELHPRYAPR